MMMPPTVPPADRHFQVIADHIRSSAHGRDRLASTLRGQRVGRPTDGYSGQAPSVPGRSASLFDEVVAAIAQRPGEVPRGVLPPASRFMVRVARVGEPTRPTKRNYNYFEELNAALAARQPGSQS